MSHNATNWAVSQRGIPADAKVLLWQLADRHNPDHGCFPDQATLERDCEFSRSTINRRLKDLEEAGLIKRIQRVHPVTKKKLPTRYVLGFEPDFGSIIGDESRADDAEESAEAMCQPDTRLSESHVSAQTETMCQPRPEPCVTADTHISSLTSKLTGKGTSKRAVRAGRDLDFKNLWKVFPVRPGSNQMEAWEVFEALEDGDAAKALKGAERFAQHFREETAKHSGPAEEGPIRYVPHLSNWLRKQGWIAAATLPIKAPLPAEAAALLDGKISVNKWSQHDLFLACEAVRGTGPAPVGKSGTWSFTTEVVEEAKRRLAAKGSGPP